MLKCNFEKLEMAMAAACMSKTQLAAEIEMTRRGLAYYFEGRRKPPIEVIGKIARALGVPVSAIVVKEKKGGYKNERNNPYYGIYNRKI